MMTHEELEAFIRARELCQHGTTCHGYCVGCGMDMEPGTRCDIRPTWIDAAAVEIAKHIEGDDDKLIAAIAGSIERHWREA